MKGTRTWFGFVSFVGVFCAASAGQSYTADVLPSLGGPGTVAYGVNEAGDVVGASDRLEGDFRACIWIGGEVTDLGTLPEGGVSTAFSVNNDRVVVGRAQNSGGTDRAVRWIPDGSGGWTIEDLGTLKADNTGFGWATRISNSGYIVGYATSEAGSYHAFRWQNGTKIDLGTLAWTGSLAYSQGLGVNEAGQSVGFAYRVLGGPEHGFFHDGATQTDITPAGQFSLAQGHNVNDAGVIGGYLGGPIAGGGFQAARRRPAEDWQLIPRLEGHTDSYGYDINNSDWVVGVSFNPQEPADFRGFVFANDTALDLNAITSGAPGQIAEAGDISNSGLIAAIADGAAGPVALRLRPASDACTGDVDGDNDVDLADLATLLSNFGATGVGVPGDIDADNDVDLADLATLLSNFGTVCE